MINHNQMPAIERVSKYAFFGACIGSLAIGFGLSGSKAAAEKVIQKVSDMAPVLPNSTEQMLPYEGLSKTDQEIISSTDLAEEQKDFIRWIWPKIANQKRQGAPIQVPVVAAQAILETGYGTHAPNNVYFGIKSYGDSQVSGVHRTVEKVDGQYIETNATFRHYDSFDQSLADYVHMIETAPWYSDAKEANDWRAYLYGLQHDSHYANEQGDPLIYATAGEDYSDAIIDIIEKNHLDQLSS